jgi:hypothetical protein
MEHGIRIFVDCSIIATGVLFGYAPFDKTRVRAGWAKLAFGIMAVIWTAVGVVRLAADLNGFQLSDDAADRVNTWFYITTGIIIGFWISLVLSGQFPGAKRDGETGSSGRNPSFKRIATLVCITAITTAVIEFYVFKRPSTQSPVNPNMPVLKVAVSADGRLTVDGTASTVQALRESLESLSEKHGVVLYYCDVSRKEPPAIAKDVLMAIIDARLPVRLSSRPDYSDAVGLEDSAPAGPIVFEVADIVLVPGEHWNELRSGPFTWGKDICLPMLKGKDEFKGVGIQVAADPTDPSSLDEAAAFWRKQDEVNPEILPGSLQEDKFTTDAGVAGVHLAFDEQRETNGIKAKSHNSIFIVKNARGVNVTLFVIASGVGHEPADLGPTDQMIRKTLRWK